MKFNLAACIAVVIICSLIAWTPLFAANEQVLYSFDSLYKTRDGIGPEGNLIFDSLGNLFGTTSGGGFYRGRCAGNGCGTVFELRHNETEAGPKKFSTGSVLTRATVSSLFPA